jgi:hypothetical protein
MKQSLSALLLSVCLFMVGCGGPAEPTAAEDKKMRDAMDGKNFDPSKMSPEARKMMEQMNTKQTPAPSGGVPAPSGGATPGN